MLGLERVPLVVKVFVFAPQRARLGKAVEQLALFVDREERLVIVRPVEIDERSAQRVEHGQRCGAGVDELPVGPGAGEGPLEDELVAVARLHALCFEPAVELRVLGKLEDGFHRAAVGAGADEALVGAFAQDQLERAENDRLA